jgi:site-specific recombinase XerD
VRKFVSVSKRGVQYAKQTINMRTIALSVIFDFLLENDICEANPVVLYREQKMSKKGGKGGRVSTRLPSVLSWDEQERLLFESMLDESLSGVRNCAMIAFFLDTGVRAEELTNLHLSAAEDYMTGRIRVIGKGNKERLIQFKPRYQSCLANWVARRKAMRCKNGVEQFLFVSERGSKMTQSVMYPNINKLLKSAKIEEKQQMGAHLLRHTAASIMLAEGKSLIEVQENMGHSSIVTTENYLHLLSGNDCI